jgi:hypothetical protein
MRNRVIIAMVGALLVATPAFGQTTSTTTPGTTPSTQRAFARLSPGNQNIAQALYDAQVAPAPTSTGTTTASAPTRLTLDQIAAMKQGGQGWGNVFKQMKAQGLVDAKNLGQVISASHHRGSTTSPTSPTTTSYHSTGPVVSNAAGSTTVASSSDHGKSSGHGPDASGVTKGGQGATVGGGTDSALAGVTSGGRGAGVVNRGGGKDK